jgi:hypothetical protein
VAKKKILVGLKRVKFFEIDQDDAEGYSVKTSPTGGFEIEGVQSITRDMQSQTTNIEGDDDAAYDVLTGVTSVNSQMTFAKLDLETKAMLGFGVIDEVTGAYLSSLDSSSKTFAVSFLSQYNNNKYRLNKFYKFTPSTVSDGGLNTKNGQNYTPQILSGAFGRRSVDNLAFAEKDSAGITLTDVELDWLDDFTYSTKS